MDAPLKPIASLKKIPRQREEPSSLWITNPLMPTFSHQCSPREVINGYKVGQEVTMKKSQGYGHAFHLEMVLQLWKSAVSYLRR